MTESDRSVAMERVLRSVRALHERALSSERQASSYLDRVHPKQRASAENLLHYLALRQEDQRELQSALSRLGLSSLGRTESHVLASIEAVYSVLRQLHPGVDSEAFSASARIGHDEGPLLLRQHTQELLGPAPAERDVRIMVTLPSEAAEQPELAEQLLVAGMDVARINGAHDDPDAWRTMADHVRSAAQRRGRPCKILFDIAGPKLRTGEMQKVPGVLRIKPERDERGIACGPRLARLATSAQQASNADELIVPISGALWEQARPGDEVTLQECSGKKLRALVAESNEAKGILVECWASGYVESGASVRLVRNGDCVGKDRVDALPHREPPLRLAAGDELLVTPPGTLGRAASEQGPASVSCSLPELLEDTHVGERIWFDDGRIGGVIREVTEAGLRVEIQSPRVGRAKLRSDKGINLPDTRLRVPSLTAKDHADLRVVATFVDLVGLSFVRTPADVRSLVGALQGLDAGHLGVVLKIETLAAFDCLPELLLEGMTCRALGVMLARGDLAVEIGFERLAEVQEEILWFAEAAHVPVIWATQVLEQLAKKGTPSRAEVTDAAMSSRAECVMLNKGRHILDAVTFLDDVLQRMAPHQQKKRSMLRRLQVSTFPR